MHSNTYPHLRCAVLMAVLLFTASVSAQSVLSACGGYAPSAAGSLNYTLGQVAVGYAEGRFTTMQWRGASLNEGVQQPYIVEELQGKGDSQRLTAKVYPNPTTDGITIDLDATTEGYAYTLYSLVGSIVGRGELQGNTTHIDMRHLPSGTYLLGMTDGQHENRWKIIKK